MTLNGVLALVGLALTSLSVAFAGYQLSRGRRSTQARFLFDINAWLFADKDVRKLYYKLDYEVWTFDENNFRFSADECALDKMLHTFDVIERLIESKDIRRRDMVFLEFEAAQILNHPEVQRYFAWLDADWSADRREGRPFAAARRLAATLPRFI